MPEQLDEDWADWAGGKMVTVTKDEDDLPVSTLTGILDQAALQGFLGRLYSQGLPLIAVICVEYASEEERSKI